MKRLLMGSVATAALCLSTAAGATVVFNMDTIADGPTPSGSSPWLVATINNVSGGVTIKLENHLASGAEFISEALFNLDPAITDLSGMTASTSDTSVGTTSDWSLLKNINGLTGGGATGKFDSGFGFQTSNSAARFTGGESVTFTVLMTGLDENDFLYFSQTGNPSHPSYTGWSAVAHVQGITVNGNSCSTWIGDWNSTAPAPAPTNTQACTRHEVPEPGTLGLLGLGLAGFGFGFKRRQT